MFASDPTHLKPRLARGETTLGLWVTLESPSITEIAVTLGLDWVVIDTEHGSPRLQGSRRAHPRDPEHDHHAAGPDSRDDARESSSACSISAPTGSSCRR